MPHEWDVRSGAERQERGCRRVPTAADGRSLGNEEALEKSCLSTVVASKGATPADAPRIPNKSLCNYGRTQVGFWSALLGTPQKPELWVTVLPPTVEMQTTTPSRVLPEESVLWLCGPACLYLDWENPKLCSSWSFRKYNPGSGTGTFLCEHVRISANVQQGPILINKGVIWNKIQSQTVSNVINKVLPVCSTQWVLILMTFSVGESWITHSWPFSTWSLFSNYWISFYYSPLTAANESYSSQLEPARWGKAKKKGKKIKYAENESTRCPGGQIWITNNIINLPARQECTISHGWGVQIPGTTFASR